MGVCTGTLGTHLVVSTVQSSAQAHVLMEAVEMSLGRRDYYEAKDAERPQEQPQLHRK